MTAPVTVIVAHDSAFYDKLPFLFPHADAFVSNGGYGSAIAAETPCERCASSAST